MSSACSRSTGRSSTLTWCGTRRPGSPKAFAFCAMRTRGAPFLLWTTSMGSRSREGQFAWTMWQTIGPPKIPMT
ncbi:RNA binding motif protein, X-linked 2 [Columba livia]|uniref:RNA binding motif protein, X-linked 2 n=1 Tax=Columba livia TaxID=8932 RepID=A0A2I0LM67_COLLI|nr:RNA binding motif protein, X-linked 2 [Columba livia]